MAEDEFFKRIAESEGRSDAPPSDRPIGTAARRGLSANASKAVKRAFDEPDEQALEEDREKVVVDAPTTGKRSLHLRYAASRWRAFGHIKPRRKRIVAIAGVALAAGLAVTMFVLGLAGHGGQSTSARDGEAAQLASQLEVVKADQRTMTEALARERVARQAELLRLAHVRRRPRKRSDSAEIAVVPATVAPVVQERPGGTQESFGFERPSP